MFPSLTLTALLVYHGSQSVELTVRNPFLVAKKVTLQKVTPLKVTPLEAIVPVSTSSL